LSFEIKLEKLYKVICISNVTQESKYLAVVLKTGDTEGKEE